MAKMTKEEKLEKLAAKKAADKAKKAAKKAALIEKKKKAAEAKKAKREAKKAKKLAKIEKEKAKKAALKEKKRLMKEKQRLAKEKKTTKKAIKETNKKIVATDSIDIKAAAKNIKSAMAQIAAEFSILDDAKRIKKAKSIRWMGYDVESVDGNVVVRFDVEKSKKIKTSDTNAPVEKVAPVKKERKPRSMKVKLVVSSNAAGDTDSHTTNDSTKVPDEVVIESENQPFPAPTDTVDSLMDSGTSNESNGEVANIDENDEELAPPTSDYDTNQDGENEDDDFTTDYRDEQDEEIIDNRREFFGQFGEDFEPNDD